MKILKKCYVFRKYIITPMIINIITNPIMLVIGSDSLVAEEKAEGACDNIDEENLG
jgi:hypothetical protein